MKTRLLALAVLVAGGAAIASELEAGDTAASQIQIAPTPLAPVAPKAVVVTISSATLGDECGESPDPAPAPKRKAKGKAKAKSDAESQTKPSESVAAADASMPADSARGVAARRACDQTSMQLSVRSGAEAAAADIKIKKVELYDETDKLIGTLKSRGPSVWSTGAGAYQTWDEKSVPGTDLMVRYVLAAPDWSKVKNRFDRSYKVKVTLTVGGADQKLERDVYLESQTTLPPGVVT